MSASVISSIFCFLSTIFIIQLTPPFYGLQRITFQVGLIAAIHVLAVILSAQCIGITGNQVRERINEILIVFISQWFMAIIHGGFDARKIYVYFLPTTITALFLPRTPPLSTPTRCTSKRKSKKRSNRHKKSAAVEDSGGEKPLSPTPTTPSPPATSSLLVFDETILGYGTNDTVLYEGSFQGRAAAIKRYLQDSVSLATREVSILEQSDDHPNVTRYYYQESHPKFFYIALELCPGSLADIIEKVHDEATEVEDRRREEWKKIARGLDAKKAVKQVASGLRHLHGLGLVHRDIKPQNILISPSSSSRGGYRMLISDFGLCKKLGVNQSSFLPATYGVIAPGTAGWSAPEMLLDTLATSDDTNTTINGSSSGTSAEVCVTKSVDIFALGCLFYYILTKGGHPFGKLSDREANIIKENKDLSLIYSDKEAHDLITHMLHRKPSQRPDIETCLLHPFFWTSAKRLGFLQDASDRFEAMCKDPMDEVLIRLERDAKSIVGTDWHQTLDQKFIKNLRQSRKYDGSSVRDLLRALRNKRHHYQDLPDDVKLQLGTIPEGFLAYFTCRYPRLLIYVHEVVKDTGLYHEPEFATYFELPET